MSDQVPANEAPLPLSHPVLATDIGPNGLELELKPDEAARAALARHVGVLALPAFTARILIAPEGSAGFHITGSLRATVRQNCGVTLEPFDALLDEKLDVHFVPEGTPLPPESEEDEEFDPPDEILGGKIDVGALATEFLALGVDPYPRKPDAVFEVPQQSAEAASPFAVLTRLKDHQ